MDGDVEALGTRVSLATVDWVARQQSHLWTYHLHYFDVVPALLHLHLAGDRRALPSLLEQVDRWISATAGGRGDGWDPYPTSIRVIHWMRLLVVTGHELPAARTSAIEASVAAQLRQLRSRIEWHLLGNHVLKNLCALAWGACLYEGPDADDWRDRPVQWLHREYRTQVLRDGAHEERTPAYHLIALHDLLEVLSVARAAETEWPALVEVAHRMHRAGSRFIRADGSLHLFGDSANDSGASWADVEHLARRLLRPEPPRDVGAWALADAGYWGARVGPAQLIIDCGPIGAPHQPAHGHCDLLSFELDIDGAPVFVDSGVHGYEGDPFRAYARSTAAHNTVAIAGREQAEVWHVFRVGRRPRVLSAGARASEPEYVFAGSYQPYGSTAIHEREVRLAPNRLQIVDRIACRTPLPVDCYLHLHPAWRARIEDREVRIAHGQRELVVRWSGVDELLIREGSRSPVQGWYFPRMSEAQPATCIVARVRPSTNPVFGFSMEF